MTQSDPKVAADMAVNAVLHYLNESGLRSQNEKQEWIAKVFAAVKSRAK